MIRDVFISEGQIYLIGNYKYIYVIIFKVYKNKYIKYNKNQYNYKI